MTHARSCSVSCMRMTPTAYDAQFSQSARGPPLPTADRRRECMQTGAANRRGVPTARACRRAPNTEHDARASHRQHSPTSGDRRERRTKSPPRPRRVARPHRVTTPPVRWPRRAAHSAKRSRRRLERRAPGTRSARAAQHGGLRVERVCRAPRPTRPSSAAARRLSAVLRRSCLVLLLRPASTHGRHMITSRGKSTAD